jgi:hypothetical protein
MVGVSDSGDAGKTRVMPRIESPAGPSGARRPPEDGGKKRTWLYVTLGVLGGALLGALIAWFVVASSAGKPGVVPTVATSTVDASASTGAATTKPSQSTAAEKTPQEPDNTAPGTPKVTFPPTNYWLSPDNLKVEIKWSRVSDPSGVSYVLEFSNWLGGGAGWSDSKRTAPVKRLYLNHTVTGIKERFRIIAIDGTGNESDPSDYRFLIPAASASEAASLNAQ